MEPKDLSQYIAEIAKSYIYPETPKEISAFEQITMQMLRYLIDFLSSLNIKLPYPTHENLMTMYMMLAIFIVAFMAISVLVIVLIKSVKQNAQRVAAHKPVDANLEPLLDSSSWLSIANELASENNYRSACRAVFLATLLTLDEMSISEFVPALSNYEYLYRLTQHKNIQGKVRELANKVDLIWFGNHEANASDFQSCRSLYQAIKKDAEDALNRRLSYAQ
jgi:hypothetical protein